MSFSPNNVVSRMITHLWQYYHICQVFASIFNQKLVSFFIFHFLTNIFLVYFTKSPNKYPPPLVIYDTQEAEGISSPFTLKQR